MRKDGLFTKRIWSQLLNINLKEEVQWSGPSILLHNIRHVGSKNLSMGLNRLLDHDAGITPMTVFRAY